MICHRLLLLILVFLLITVSSYAGTKVKPAVDISADKETVSTGAPVLLSWSSSDANTCTIDNGIGPVGTSGTHTVYPTQTTTYTITAEGDGGTVSHSVTIGVLPEIISFTISAGEIKEGEAVTLSWETRLADSCSISPVQGSVQLTDTAVVSPTADTTYTLSATSSVGTTTEEVRVIVIPFVQHKTEFEYDAAGRIKGIRVGAE